jgi:ubiquinone/menaquinone biosynthesis C-methylase UbiE
MKNVIYALTKVYRNYCFYMAPARLVIRGTVKRFFSNQSPCPKILEVGGGTAMMKDLLRTSCRSQQFISSDIAPTENTDVVCDAQDLPFSDSEFDLVAAFDVMEHIPDTHKFLGEISRVLQRDGYVTMSIPFMYGRHDQQDFYRWTPQGLEKTLGDHGFKVVALKKIGGICLTLLTLIAQYVYHRTAPLNLGWRANKFNEKLYYVVLKIIVFPIDVLSWIAFFLDALIDNDSANPGGLVFVAQKVS